MRRGTSLVVQWLRLHGSYAEGGGSVPGWGTKIPHGVWHGQKIKKQSKKSYCEENKQDDVVVFREAYLGPMVWKCLSEKVS